MYPLPNHGERGVLTARAHLAFCKDEQLTPFTKYVISKKVTSRCCKTYHET